MKKKHHLYLIKWLFLAGNVEFTMIQSGKWELLVFVFTDHSNIRFVEMGFFLISEQKVSFQQPASFYARRVKNREENNILVMGI